MLSAGEVPIAIFNTTTTTTKKYYNHTSEDIYST
jgi:hypothetical protein